MIPIPEDKMEEIKKGDLRYLWYKGAVRKVKVLSTYNEPNGKGICVEYETKTTCGSTWVNINKLFFTEEECLQNHISNLQKKHKKTVANLKTQGAPPSFNKDLTATQQVSSPKSASQTSLNPDIPD